MILDNQMTFWKVKSCLETLLLGSRQVLVGLQFIHFIRVVRWIRGIGTHVGVEEERVCSPGEGFGTDVEVIVVGREGKVTIVLGLEVFLVLGVFSLNLLHPEVASRDCSSGLTQISLLPRVKGHLLAGRQP